MRRIHTIPRTLLLALLLSACASGAAHGQQSSLLGQDVTPRSTNLMPGVNPSPIKNTPLSARPYVYALERRDQGQMTPQDASVVSMRTAELDKAAAFLNFDLSATGWRYQQILCPSFPDYLFLNFTHGPDPNGSSRFVAVMERDGPFVRVVPSYAHGLRPFSPASSKRATYEAFNAVLRQERGLVSLSFAPNWLVIGMCFAEFTGEHVQVFTSQPQPGPSMDLLRLGANLPQLHIAPDRAAQISFSDASKAALTTDWMLSFDRHGQIVSADRQTQRQPRKIAITPQP